MSLLPGLEAELLGAARRTDPTRAPGRGASPVGRQARRSRRHFGLFALVGLLVFTGGAYASRGVWQPVLGNDETGRPVASREAPPIKQTSVLGVLRRPQTDEDRGLASSAALRGFQPRDGEIRTAYVRKLATLPNRSVAVLVPVDQKSIDDPAYAKGDHAQLCIAVVPTRGDMEPPTCGPTWQVLVGDGLSVETWDPYSPTQERDRDRAIRKAQREGKLPKPGEKGNGRVSTAVANAIEDATYSHDLQRPTSYTVNLVPDVVKRVRFFQEPGEPELPVRGNVVVRKVRPGLPPSSTTWIDEDGRSLNADGVRVAPSALVP